MNEQALRSSAFSFAATAEAKPDYAPLVAAPPFAWYGVDAAAWLNCWSRMDGRARLLLTSERVLICCDSMAGEALAEGDGLRLKGGRVEPADPCMLPHLERLLGAEDGETLTLCLPRPPRESNLLLRSHVMCRPSGMAVIALTFHATGEEFEPEWAGLAEAYNITAAEHHILQMLLAGMSPDRIAREQGLSINTVRTHISRIHDKTGVCSREELWRRLAPYRVR